MDKPAEQALVTLEDLIGNMDHLTCVHSHTEIKGIKVAYWQFSNPSKPPQPPVIALHGGPAFPHTYLLPLKLLAHYGYPVIFYDQAGCGGSYVPDPEKDAPWLFTVEYYVQ